MLVSQGIVETLSRWDGKP